MVLKLTIPLSKHSVVCVLHYTGNVHPDMDSAGFEQQEVSHRSHALHQWNRH